MELINPARLPVDPMCRIIWPRRHLPPSIMPVIIINAAQRSFSSNHPLHLLLLLLQFPFPSWRPFKSTIQTEVWVQSQLYSPVKYQRNQRRHPSTWLQRRLTHTLTRLQRRLTHTTTRLQRRLMPMDQNWERWFVYHPCLTGTWKSMTPILCAQQSICVNLLGTKNL
jgi:hypothetical protein